MTPDDLNSLIATKPYPAHGPLEWLPWAQKPRWLVTNAGTSAFELGKFIINQAPGLNYLVYAQAANGSLTVHTYLCVGPRH